MKNQNFIRFLVPVAAVVLSLWATDHFINSKVRKLENGEFGKINSIMIHALDEPVMIWGASTALVHFNPRIIQDSLKMGVYNMGVDGTNIDQYYGLLKEYLDYSENCKYLAIVIDIHGGLVDRGALYNVHLWAAHLRNRNVYESFIDVDPWLTLKSRWVPFYDLTLHNRTTFSCVKNELLGQAETTVKDNLGFYPKDLPPIDTTAMVKSTEIVRPKSESQPVNPRSIGKVRSACKLAVKKQIQPIIVIPPCYKRGLKQLGSEDQFMDSIYTLRQEGAIVLNYLNSDLTTQTELFYNNTHMNHRGADLLSSQFAEDLNRNISKP